MILFFSEGSTLIKMSITKLPKFSQSFLWLINIFFVGWDKFAARENWTKSSSTASWSSLGILSNTFFDLIAPFLNLFLISCRSCSFICSSIWLRYSDISSAICCLLLTSLLARPLHNSMSFFTRSSCIEKLSLPAVAISSNSSTSKISKEISPSM